MERQNNPEFGFRSCYGVLRLTRSREPDRFDAACRYALELGTRTYRGLDNILRIGADRAAAREPEIAPIDHSNIINADTLVMPRGPPIALMTRPPRNAMSA